MQGPPKPAGPAAPFPKRDAAPADRKACLDELARLELTFEVVAPAADRSACSVANPVLVTSFGGRIKVEPPALVDCPMALAAARFLRDVVAPQARRAFGAELVGVSQASGFVCRPRNGTEKPSEHAFGNAIDISAFVLSNSRRIEVKAGGDAADMAFLGSVRAAACGPFRTVLGPGSDADHATHFHFDLQPRRADASFCR